MVSLNLLKLKQLINEKENNRVDFKLSYSFGYKTSKKDLANDVCAIANYLFLNSGTGYLIIGIEDKTNKLIGVNLEDYSEERIQQSICSNSDPPPEFNIDYMNLDGKNLVIISIEKNINSLHQVKRLGFPIRRGPTNDLMLTSEIIHAIETKIREFDFEKNEYDIYGKEIKEGKILQDTVECLKKLDFSNVTPVFYPGDEFGKITSYECNFVKANKTIGENEYEFYLTFQENGNEKGLFKIHYSVEGFSRSINKNKAIFVHLIKGSFSNSFFSKIIYDDYLAQDKISNVIRYLGLGYSASEEIRYKNSFYIPTVYIGKIKSEKDISNKIETLLRWIKDNNKILNMVNMLRF
jgi:hypothetical protein